MLERVSPALPERFLPKGDLVQACQDTTGHPGRWKLATVSHHPRTASRMASYAEISACVPQRSFPESPGCSSPFQCASELMQESSAVMPDTHLQYAGRASVSEHFRGTYANKRRGRTNARTLRKADMQLRLSRRNGHWSQMLRCRNGDSD